MATQGQRAVKVPGAQLIVGYEVMPAGLESVEFQDGRVLVSLQDRIDPFNETCYMGDGQRQTHAGEEVLVDDFVRKNALSFLLDGQFMIVPVEEDRESSRTSPASIAEFGERFYLAWKDGRQAFRAIPESADVIAGDTGFVYPAPDEYDGAGRELVVKVADESDLSSLDGSRVAETMISDLGGFILDNPAEFPDIPRDGLVEITAPLPTEQQ